MFKKTLAVIALLSISFSLFGGDWPIYKGNLYFTGNNDELIVKNNKLKWLFQAEDKIFFPALSDGVIYFTDQKGNLYAVTQDYGELLWKRNLPRIASTFRRGSRIAGKIKHILVYKELVIAADASNIYAFNKKSGAVHWARPGVSESVLVQPGTRNRFRVRRDLRFLSGIYSSPVLHKDRLFYGTRTSFLARDISNGHFSWSNDSIQSYSGFPTYYDEYIITQSRDYRRNTYTLLCLSTKTGKAIWQKNLPRPFKIFAPVVHKKSVYLPLGRGMIALDLKTGEQLWEKDYGRIFTSIPGFTDRSILVSVDNSDILVLNPKSGNIQNTIKVGYKTGPRYVMIRDQVYVAYNAVDEVSGKKYPYGTVRALNFSENKVLWEFKPPFPGAISQPVAEGSILFLPAGNYLYAIGAQSYPRVVRGGSGFHPDGKKQRIIEELKRRGSGIVKDIPQRKLKLTVTDEGKNGIPVEVEVRKKKKGKIVYSKKVRVPKTGVIDIPTGTETELLIEARDYIPKKVKIKPGDNEKKVTLNKLEKEKPIRMDNIYFETNKAYLKPESLDILNAMVKLLKRRTDLRLLVLGHTDSTGSREHNQKLSERRADAVMEYMIKQGISPERLSSIGYGQDSPVANNETREGRARNRRTEFIFSENRF